MGQLGGGSTYAVLGMRVWSQQVGLVSGVGSDFPEELQDHLSASAIDLEGLLCRDMPTPRAWQLLEWDESRTEIFRTDTEQFRLMLPDPSEVPASYHSAAGIHTLDFGDVTLVKELREQFPRATLAWEPYLPTTGGGARRDAILETLSYVDIFLPSYSEITRVYGITDIERILNELLEKGVQTVGIRMGKEGSIVGTKDGVTHQIPIFPSQIADTTGAGNAYCGGFLVGYVESGDALHAGLCGTVAASFIIEQVGPSVIKTGIEREVRRRYEWLRAQISR